MDTIITEKIYEEQQKNNRISNFFKTFNVSNAIKRSNFHKQKGTNPIELLKYVFGLVFMNKNIYFDTKYFPNKGRSKNTVYRFLNSSIYDWCKLLYLVALNVIAFLIPLTSEYRENVLIIDETLYSRSRSKKVDMLSRVYDHNSSKYIKGFKLLTAAWSDGNTTIPLCYRLLSSTNEKMVINALPDSLDKRTRAYKLRKSAQINPVEAMNELISQIDTKRLGVKYILFDSWFAFPSVIIGLLDKGLNTICMLKRMYRIYYTYNGKQYNLKELYNHVPHNRSGEIIPSVIVRIHNNEGKEKQVKVLFLRSKKSNDWVALLSTNTEISDEEMIRIYSKRWNIEVLFKTCKHYLKLDTELEGRRFEAVNAHSSIVFLRYIMLAYENRISVDDRACGELFFFISEELKDISYSEALVILLDSVFFKAFSDGLLSMRQINLLLDIFIDKIPHLFLFSAAF